MLEKKLNALLANYEVMLHKLQAYHWYVKGRSFFCDHAKFEEWYVQAFEAVDAIAEKILMTGGEPLATMKDMMAEATIKEASSKPVTREDVYKSARDDFNVLLEGTLDVKRAAEEDENFLISAFADTLIEQLSKDLWMLSQALA